MGASYWPYLSFLIPIHKYAKKSKIHKWDKIILKFLVQLLARDLIHARISTEVDSIACVMLILEITSHKKVTSHCITYSSMVCPIVTELLLKGDQQV